MERAERDRASRAAYRLFLRLCGVGAILGGILFVVWGYVDRPNLPTYLRTVVDGLSFFVPMLFLVGVSGLVLVYARLLGVLGWMGSVLALWGPACGMVDAIFSNPLSYGLSLCMPGGLFLMLSGLALVGIATVGARTLRRLGMLVLATGLFGWVYYFSDSGAILGMRLVHVLCGLLFSLGWVALGLRFLGEGAKPHPR